ncbi:MAG: bifunctional phosphopantothenoylcysteine decarboxylase/phosphopantothenate--cysteine ligase CoaBC [Sulfolobales archaeon]|nr:bifunctional phosphopantothenoylcysteine decarboxylase/phosphopantothenate--cysteine ligase CoaBC [Sulfolobales archaeon]
MIGYHPSNEVRGSHSTSLKNIKIVLGVTSGVAIYKAVDVARELIRRDADVHVVMSPEATKLVSPQLFEWATGNEVYVEFHGESGHVALSRICNSMIIAPATANTIAKIASGIADTSVSLTALNFMGLGKPLLLVPSMHLAMYRSPQITEALSKLKSYGVRVLEPIIEGARAKLPDVDDIVLGAEAITLRGSDLKGIKILITAGPTREFLDPVRFITNASSGRMGVAIAREAFFRNADVTLIHGPIDGSLVPKYVRTLKVTTTYEMFEAVINELRSNDYDAIILAGAPSDFRFREVSKDKIDSRKDAITLTLEPTPKISEGIRKMFDGLLVGFAAETVGGDIKALRDRALRKLTDRGFNVIVANDVMREDIGFASEYDEVLILGSDGFEKYVGKARKEIIAREILDIVKKLLGF